MANGYQPHFDRDLKRGEVGEQLLDLFFTDSEDNVLFEVKTDYKLSQTGNLFIETHKFRNPDQSDLAPSGLNVTKAKWLVISSPVKQVLINIGIDTLREYINLVNPPKRTQPIADRSTAGSIGWIIPLKGLLKFSHMWKSDD